MKGASRPCRRCLRWQCAANRRLTGLHARAPAVCRRVARSNQGQGSYSPHLHGSWMRRRSPALDHLRMPGSASCLAACLRSKTRRTAQLNPAVQRPRMRLGSIQALNCTGQGLQGEGTSAFQPSSSSSVQPPTPPAVRSARDAIPPPPAQLPPAQLHVVLSLYTKRCLTETERLQGYRSNRGDKDDF